MNNLSLSLDRFSMGFMALPESRPSQPSKSDTLAIRETDSDEHLLIAVGNRQDRVAFNTLFSRFANRIFAMGMKLTRNEQLAHDLVQEALLMVWQKAPLYDLDRGNAQGWIFTIARNRCFDMLRKARRQPVCVSADDIWPIDGEPGDTSTAGESGYHSVELSQVEQYYGQLPEAQLAVIEQIYVHDRTHEEAAELLQIPLGTLKSRLRLGMEKLRTLVGVES